jgi:hypothetical protein
MLGALASPTTHRAGAVKQEPADTRRVDSARIVLACQPVTLTEQVTAA